MSFDWSTVNWTYVSELTAIVFVAALIGNLLSFRSWLVGAILAAVLFAAGYVFFTNCHSIVNNDNFCPFVLPTVPKTTI
jgi:uncharacterized membrane protein